MDKAGLTVGDNRGNCPLIRNGHLAGPGPMKRCKMVHHAAFAQVRTAPCVHAALHRVKVSVILCESLRTRNNGDLGLCALFLTWHRGICRASVPGIAPRASKLSTSGNAKWSLWCGSDSCTCRIRSARPGDSCSGKPRQVVQEGCHEVTPPTARQDPSGGQSQASQQGEAAQGQAQGEAPPSHGGSAQHDSDEAPQGDGDAEQYQE